MRIKSTFKDYYDYQATIYGIDNSILYNRNRIAEEKVVDNLYGRQIIEPDLEVDQVRGWLSGGIPQSRYNDKPSYNFKLLIVGDKILLITCGYDTVNGEYTYALVDNNHPAYVKYRHIREWIANVRDDLVLAEVTTDICRRVGHPVFIVNHVTMSRNREHLEVSIDGRCPVLKNIEGLPAFYPAAQIFQDLSYFLTNKMKTSPDESPVNTLTDKEKIVQHGMDVKQSFRHRK